jgi:hypothetical protein
MLLSWRESRHEGIGSGRSVLFEAKVFRIYVDPG